MTNILETGLVIRIVDQSPEERREYILKALVDSLRWYAQNPDKRKTDADSVCALTDLIHELSLMNV